MSLLCLFFLTTGCEKSTSSTSSRSSANLRAGSPTIRPEDKFYDVSVKNRNIWVVGYYGAILHFKDGGKTWSRQNAGVSNSLLGVDFVNENEGWAVGGFGMIIHTKDGGVKWERQQSSAPNEMLVKSSSSTIGKELSREVKLWEEIL